MRWVVGLSSKVCESHIAAVLQSHKYLSCLIYSMFVYADGPLGSTYLTRSRAAFFTGRRVLSLKSLSHDGAEGGRGSGVCSGEPSSSLGGPDRIMKRLEKHQMTHRFCSGIHSRWHRPHHVRLDKWGSM